MVGESIGGTIALQAAIDHAPRIRTLTISNGAHVGGSRNRAASTRTALSTHAGVRCAAHQRKELERLCRTITRPAIANETALIVAD